MSGVPNMSDKKLEYSIKRNNAESAANAAEFSAYGFGGLGAITGVIGLFGIMSHYLDRQWPDFFSFTVWFTIASLVLFLVMGLVYLPEYNSQTEDKEKYEKLFNETA